MSLLTPEIALERILQGLLPLPPEEVPIDLAVGRALATDVISTRTLPPWDNSAMDGYALRSADATGPGVKLKIVARIFAGDRPTTRILAGECARIMTGAALPPGADAVLMQERTRAEGDWVELLEAVAPRAAVRDRGEDTREGALLLPRGCPLGIPEAGLLWSQGLQRVSVYRRPKVAIASTGDELCSVGSAPGERIFDTNSPSIAAAVRRAGGEPTLLGLAPDRFDEVQALFSRGVDFDVLITSAGVSVGERDFTKEALESLGVKIDFWKLAIKPAKPLAMGRRGATLVFGLPGNPTSSLVSFELFVRPALRALQGLSASSPKVSGRLAIAWKKAAGLRHYLRATVDFRDGELWATPLSTQSSGALSSAASATHLISLPPDLTAVAEGDLILLIPVSWGA